MAPQILEIFSVILHMIFKLLTLTPLIKMLLLNKLIRLLLMEFELCSLVQTFQFDFGLMHSIISYGFEIHSLTITKTNHLLKFV